MTFTIGDYEVIKLLEEGSASVVYLGKKNQKQYAIKLVENTQVAMVEGPSIHAHSVALEMRILQDLPHPHIITLCAVIEGSNTTALVLEFMKDGDLCDQRPGTALLRRVAQGVAKGLRWLHRHNIVHRDIKPENILLDGTTVKLCDFGLAIDMGNHETVTSDPVGTLDFLPPEILNGRTHRGSDAWSLGATLYDLSTGDPPFCEALCWRTPERIQKAQYSWPSSHQDASLRNLVAGLLVLEPMLRLTMEQVLQHPWLTPPPRRVLRSGAQRSVGATPGDARKETQ